MINVMQLNDPMPFLKFEDAVQAISDDSKGQPCTPFVLHSLEARFNAAASAAMARGELLNEKPPRATVRAYRGGAGMELSLLWSEKPVLKESRDAQ